MSHYIAYPQIIGLNGRRVITRFAPSPNGMLHIGHAYAAICAHDVARGQGGRFLLRIEDIDGTRSRAEYVEAIQADLKWLGLTWDGDVIFQSGRVESYRFALNRLKDMGLVYTCTCTRGEIAAALKKQPALHGPDGPHYPGTCRGKIINRSYRAKSRYQEIAHDLTVSRLRSTRTDFELDVTEMPYCWRLDMAAAMRQTGILTWTDVEAGKQIADPAQFGDIILWRRDTPASYHLAATIDDAADDVSHVVRGYDLFAYTGIHRLLQSLLGLRQPLYWHHPVLLDESGAKLAKSKASPALAGRRIAGEDGAEIARMLRRAELPLGITVSNP
jgi:glutamyl-Q tRNA(Asp) synthetase